MWVNYINFAIFYLLKEQNPKSTKPKPKLHIKHKIHKYKGNSKETKRTLIPNRQNRMISCCITVKKRWTRVKILTNEETHVTAASSWPSPLRDNIGNTTKTIVSSENTETWNTHLLRMSSFLWRASIETISRFHPEPSNTTEEFKTTYHLLSSSPKPLQRRASINLGRDLIRRTKPSIED